MQTDRTQDRTLGNPTRGDDVWLYIIFVDKNEMEKVASQHQLYNLTFVFFVFLL